MPTPIVSWRTVTGNGVGKALGIPVSNVLIQGQAHDEVLTMLDTRLSEKGFQTVMEPAAPISITNRRPDLIVRNKNGSDASWPRLSNATAKGLRSTIQKRLENECEGEPGNP